MASSSATMRGSRSSAASSTGLTSLPEGAAGGEVLVAGRLAHKVVVAPAGPGLRRVWVAVFTL
ncbi:hypothetical protein [Methylobacterium tarhaniae]|uniref:hypothetical protein n=1 Tax=Methylobacterium tarhaniae TaxID=1187852 RepID=UPI003D0067D0